MLKFIFGLSLIVAPAIFGFNKSLAQCTWYTITVTDSDNADEVSWELMNDLGVIVLSGGAPYEQDVCLPDGCYVLLMYDSAGNGWEDEDWIIEDWIGEFDFDTNLSDGFHGNDVVDLGDNGCSGTVDPGTCPDGTNLYQLIVTSGSAPDEISWSITLDQNIVIGGDAPYNSEICLGEGCYFFNLFDEEGDGWQGATYTFLDDNSNIVSTGTLSTGSESNVLINIGGLDCSGATPGGGGGGGGPGPGADCGNDPPGSDCSSAACVCDPYTFGITPSGFGAVNEIPVPGSVSNPSYSPFNPAPWGGTDYGCLLAGELNSSWMMFTVTGAGMLEFSFGAGGQQVGYYDWEMWSYNGLSTCADIASNSLPPVRCTWNAVSWGGTGLASTIPAGGNAGNYGPPLAVNAGEQFIICLSNWSYVNASVTLDFFGTAEIDCAMFLPVEFLDFTGKKEGSMVKLHWVTASEVDNDHFEVQRSTDTQVWTTIATRLPGIEGAINEYDALDVEPALGIDYYRIKQVDHNGAFRVSDVVAIPFDAGDEARVYPIPAVETLFIEILNQGPQRIEFLDVSGRMLDTVHDTEPGVIQMDVSNLPSGMYFIRFIDSSGNVRVKKVAVGY